MINKRWVNNTTCVVISITQKVKIGKTNGNHYIADMEKHTIKYVGYKIKTSIYYKLKE